MDQAVTLPMGDDLAATGNADITPEQAGRLLARLGSLARVIETDELLKRIERLESASANQTAR